MVRLGHSRYKGPEVEMGLEEAHSRTRAEASVAGIRQEGDGGRRGPWWADRSVRGEDVQACKNLQFLKIRVQHSEHICESSCLGHCLS